MCIYDSALDSPPLEMEENFLLFNLCTTLGLIFLFFFFYLSLRDLIKENLRFEKLFDLIFFYKFNFKWCYYFLLLFFFFFLKNDCSFNVFKQNQIPRNGIFSYEKYEEKKMFFDQWSDLQFSIERNENIYIYERYI